MFSYHFIKQRFQIVFIYCQNLSHVSLIYAFFKCIAGNVLCSTIQQETSSKIPESRKHSCVHLRVSVSEPHTLTCAIHQGKGHIENNISESTNVSTNVGMAVSTPTFFCYNCVRICVELIRFNFHQPRNTSTQLCTKGESECVSE